MKLLCVVLAVLAVAQAKNTKTGFGSVQASTTAPCQHVTCEKVDGAIQVTHKNSVQYGLAHHGPSTPDPSCTAARGGACGDSENYQHTCTHDQDTNTCSCECTTAGPQAAAQVEEDAMADKGEQNCGTAHKSPCTTQWAPNNGCSKDTSLAQPFNDNSCWPCGGNNQFACKFKYSHNQGCGPDEHIVAKGGDEDKPTTLGQHHGYNEVNPNPHPAGKCWHCGGDNQPRCDNKYAENNGCEPGHSGAHHANKCWACTRGNVQCTRKEDMIRVAVAPGAPSGRPISPSAPAQAANNINVDIKAPKCPEPGPNCRRMTDYLTGHICGPGRVCVVQPANPPQDPCPYESCMTGAPDHHYM